MLLCSALYRQKCKMAAATIVNCYLVTLDHPRSLLHGRKYVLIFHLNRTTTFGDMAIWKLCKFGLKRLFLPPKLSFLVALIPNIIFCHRHPKRHFLGRNRAFWDIKHRDQSSGSTGTACKEYKRGENRWGDKLGIGPANTLNPILTIFVMWGGPLDMFLKFVSRVGRSPNFGATRGQKSSLPIDKTHRLYNSLLLPHKLRCYNVYKSIK